jgi:DNA-binding beta-propeller fold protein YncE
VGGVLRATVWGLLGIAAGLAAARPAARPPISAQRAELMAASAPVLEDAPAPHPLTGSAIALSPDETLLYVADEDAAALRVFDLPLSDGPEASVRALALPGRPASIVVLGDAVLVTVRDPGLLLVVERDDRGELVERGRVEVADDAWGLAVTRDRGTALVASAWSRRVTAVDVDALQVRWSVEVEREPRAVVLLPGDDRAYVTHLVGASLTRIEGVRTASPALARVPFAAAPMRMPRDGWATERSKDGANLFPRDEWADERAEAATLAYGAVLSPDGARLFVPRQALGATGLRAWAGQATVDVMLTLDESSLARPAARDVPVWTTTWSGGTEGKFPQEDGRVTGPGPLQDLPFSQPRAVVYRRSSDTLLVASEGTDALVELDARSIEPAATPLRVHLGRAGECGAPSGVALDRSERTAFVLCRSTRAIAEVPLEAPPAERLWPLGDELLSSAAVSGRRMFYDAADRALTDGVACAGCHPEGREDGHVWHEIRGGAGGGFFASPSGAHTYAAFPMRAPTIDQHGDVVRARVLGHPRQTPMLAGRVAADGPYGWRAESPTLAARIAAGFGIHRWAGEGQTRAGATPQAEDLAAFLREGLVPPPVLRRPLSEREAIGRAVFEDPTSGCTECHEPGRDYAGVGAAWIEARGRTSFPFLSDASSRFKTPSLRFVGGTAPYYHDGSIATLRELVDRNRDHMGRTAHLDAADRDALVAYLETL